MERRSSENHGVHGVQKMDDAIPVNVMSLLGRFLFSVLRVLRVFWYLYFQEKCTHTHITTYVTTTWGRVFFLWRGEQRKSRSTRSTENGWRHTGKATGTFSVFCTPCTPCFLVFIFSRKYTYTHITYVTATWGPCGFFVDRRAAKITEYTEYRKWMALHR